MNPIYALFLGIAAFCIGHNRAQEVIRFMKLSKEECLIVFDDPFKKDYPYTFYVVDKKVCDVGYWD